MVTSSTQQSSVASPIALRARGRSVRFGIERWAYCGFVALAIGWALTSISYPFGWDQGIFAWIGDIINRSGMPYRDAWDIKGPLPYYVYALAQRLFGRNQWGIRLVDLGFLLASLVLLSRYIRVLTNRSTARWAGVVFLLWYASGSYWHTAQPDGWVGMALVFALVPLALTESKLPAGRLALAGVLVGCSVLVKPLYAAFLLPVLVHVLATAGRSWRRIVSAVAIVGFALLLPLALTAAWFAYRQSWHDLVEVFLVYPVNIYVVSASPSLASRLQGLIEYILAGRVAVVVLPAAASGLVVLWREKRPAALMLLAWVGVAVFGVVLQDRFFAYHWVPAYAPLTVLAAVGFQGALDWSPEPIPGQFPKAARFARTFVLCAFVFVLFHVAVHPLVEVARWLKYATRRASAEAYYEGFGVPGPEILAANYIRQHTAQGDPIAVWGWLSTVVYLSGRHTPGRFGYSMPLLQGEGTSRCNAYQQEFMDSLRKMPPVYIVEDPRTSGMLRGHYDRKRFKEFDAFVSGHYRPETQFGELILYRRIGDRPES